MSILARIRDLIPPILPLSGYYHSEYYYHRKLNYCRCRWSFLRYLIDILYSIIYSYYVIIEWWIIWILPEKIIIGDVECQ